MGTFRGAAVLTDGRFVKLSGSGNSVQGIAHDAYGRIYLSSAEGLAVCEQARCRSLASSTPLGGMSVQPREGGGLRVLQLHNRVLDVVPGPTRVTVTAQTIPVQGPAEVEVITASGLALGLRAPEQHTACGTSPPDGCSPGARWGGPGVCWPWRRAWTSWARRTARCGASRSRAPSGSPRAPT